MNTENIIRGWMDATEESASALRLTVQEDRTRPGNWIVKNWIGRTVKVFKGPNAEADARKWASR
jgi:hypothetical protein